MLRDVLHDWPDQLRRGGKVELDLPFAGRRKLKTTIVALGSAEPGTGESLFGRDLALLQLEQDLNPAIHPPPLLQQLPEGSVAFQTYGWPAGLGGEGSEGFGTLRGVDPAGWLNAYRRNISEPFMMGGFSGGPVFSEDEGQLLGICAEKLRLGEQEERVVAGKVIPSVEILRWIRRHVSPYPGKAPFRAHHASFYCGLHDFAADLQDQLFEQGLVALTGAPKSGRSSFVRAGLAQVRAADRHFGRVVVADAAQGLTAQCKHLLEVDWAGVSDEDVGIEAQEFARLHHGLLLVVDALEAVAAGDHAEEELTLLRHLAAAARARSGGNERLAVLLVADETIRDQVPELVACDLPPESQCAMPVLGYQEVRAAVTRPAEHLGVRFAPNLVRRIINEFRWDKVELSELAASLSRMWKANGGSEYIAERAFPGFGIERALAAGENSSDLVQQEAEDDQLLKSLEDCRARRRRGRTSPAPCVCLSGERIGDLRDLAEQLEPQLMSPHRTGARLALEQVRGDLGAALETCARDPTLVQEGLRLAGALFWFWNFEADFAEGRTHLEALLAQAADWRCAAAAKAHYASGTLSFMLGDMQAARARLSRAVALWEALEPEDPGAKRWKAYALLVLGRATDRLDEARQLEEKAVDIMGHVNDGWGLALALNDAGYVAAAAGDREGAKDFYGRSISQWRARRDFWGLPLALVNYGAWAVEVGDNGLAAQALKQAHDIHRFFADRWEIPNTLRHIAELDIREGRVGAAAKGFRESLNLARKLERQQVVTDNLLGVARCLLKGPPDEFSHRRAARLLGGWRRQVEANHFPVTTAQLRSEQEALSVLGERWDAELGHGRELEPDKLVKLALET